MSVYIFTLPKAGTYFLAEMLSNMGLNNTGRHIFDSFFLDTHSFTLEQNAATPGIAQVDRFFVPVIRQMKPKDVTFGHFPLPLNPEVARPHVKYICSYRHPQKTLVSEFIDFRFRRHDIDWVSPRQEPDDGLAFELYLEYHGTTHHARNLKDIILYKTLMNSPLVEKDEKQRGLFLNFETVLKDAKTVQQIARFLDIKLSAQDALAVHNKTLMAETKTKAVDLQIDRNALWTPRARKLFDKSDFPRILKLGHAQGLRF